MAEAAKLADVSAAAPHRHFKRAERRLITELARARGSSYSPICWNLPIRMANPRPLTAFEAVGRAYLAFARAHPGHYVAMFESGISPARNARSCRSVAARQCRACCALPLIWSARNPRSAAPPPPEMFAAHVSAMSHGIVGLYRARHTGRARAVFARKRPAGNGESEFTCADWAYWPCDTDRD